MAIHRMITVSARIVTLLALALLGAGCQLRSGGSGNDADSGGPFMTFTRVSIAEYDGSSRLWDLRAAEVDYDNRIARLKDVKVQIFRGNNLSVECEAPAGDFDTLTRDLKLAGPVRVSAQGGRALLEAESITWSGPAHKLVAQGRVEIQHGPSRLQAFGLEADTANSRVVLAGPIDGKFQIAHPGRRGR